MLAKLKSIKNHYVPMAIFLTTLGIICSYFFFPFFYFEVLVKFFLALMSLVGFVIIYLFIFFLCNANYDADDWF